MRITVRCKCDAKFTITEKCKNQGPFVCQNCSRPLPNEISDTLKGLLDSVVHLNKATRNAELYEVEISETKI